MREKVTKSGLTEVGAQLLVDLDKQIESLYGFDRDEIWKESLSIACETARCMRFSHRTVGRALGTQDGGVDLIAKIPHFDQRKSCFPSSTGCDQVRKDQLISLLNGDSDNAECAERDLEKEFGAEWQEEGRLWKISFGSSQRKSR
jgi:hypothetical protein